MIWINFLHFRAGPLIGKRVIVSPLGPTTAMLLFHFFNLPAEFLGVVETARRWRGLGF